MNKKPVEQEQRERGMGQNNRNKGKTERGRRAGGGKKHGGRVGWAAFPAIQP